VRQLVGLGRFETLARGVIGKHRRSTVVKALHGLTSFVESAYSNEGSNFASNGEQLLLRKLRPANFHVAVDVGANVGDWLTEALAVWPACHIHAFEVAPQTFQRLSERARASEQSGRIALNRVGARVSSECTISRITQNSPAICLVMARMGQCSSMLSW
jgi:hypothetical protein